VIVMWLARQTRNQDQGSGSCLDSGLRDYHVTSMGKVFTRWTGVPVNQAVHFSGVDKLIRASAGS
jgi:hypothetical protein